MNMQKLMQQAQAMQKEINTIQKEIENTDFTSEKEHRNALKSIYQILSIAFYHLLFVVIHFFS